MPNPIVIAYHLIWTAYGWWLPNDLRGSSSHAIASDLIAELGALHQGRKKIQPAGRLIRRFYEDAAGLLKYPLLQFGEREIACIGRAFAQAVEECKYTCYACMIMPDHIHLLIRKHKHLAEEMIANFQRMSQICLKDEGLRGMEHPVWGGPGWKVFLDEPNDVWRVIEYVDENPDKIGQPRQRWPYVIPYNNWPLHEGHDPNSPYARRLRQSRGY
jgi:REP element-mobilizing transposase RayT